jgi:bacterial leucyl aminopeptidase
MDPFKSNHPFGGDDSNRDIYDGALGRSDHYSFQIHGYSACVVSEDFFSNLNSEPLRDANPNYHSKKDKVVDIDYATDIADTVALAIKEFAT